MLIKFFLSCISLSITSSAGQKHRPTHNPFLRHVRECCPNPSPPSPLFQRSHDTAAARTRANIPPCPCWLRQYEDREAGPKSALVPWVTFSIWGPALGFWYASTGENRDQMWTAWHGDSACLDALNRGIVLMWIRYHYRTDQVERNTALNETWQEQESVSLINS